MTCSFVDLAVEIVQCLSTVRYKERSEWRGFVDDINRAKEKERSVGRPQLFVVLMRPTAGALSAAAAALALTVC